MADQLRKYKSLYSSTAATFGEGEAVTITPASVVGLPTDTEITLTFDRVDSSGTKTPAKMERIRGTIVGGNFVVSSGGRAVEGTEQTHTSPVVEMIWNADDWNDAVDTILVEHSQTGVHSNALVTTLKTTGAKINTGLVDDEIVTPKAIADSNIKQMIDEDTMASNLDTKVPSQQSVKAYVDSTNNGWIPSGETWVYASADDPTFTFTIAGVDLTTKYSAGMRIKLTQTTVKYFIITAVAFSTDTTITVYGGTDYDLANAAITSPYYSTQKAPQGFPLDPAKWTVETVDTTQRTLVTPSTGAWNNPNSADSIIAPIGVWDGSYFVFAYDDGSTLNQLFSTLSTANNTESNPDSTDTLGSETKIIGGLQKRFSLTVASKTTYYLNLKSVHTAAVYLYANNNTVPLNIRLRCAYL